MRPLHVLTVLGASLFLGCSGPAPPRAPTSNGSSEPSADADGTRLAEDPPSHLRVAILAGGCFWCLEGPLERIAGVGEVLSGYTGGDVEHVTYRQIGRGSTGHVEAVRVVYDPAQVTFAQILEVFVRNIDPTQDDGQFCDRGTQYRSAIFVANAEERVAAEAALASARATLGRAVVTEIRDVAPFWVAEDYHQDFYRTHPDRYHSYHEHSGRREFLRAHWGPDADY